MLRPVSLYITCLVFLLIGQTTAQFLLDYPPSIGYNGTLGLEAFCGGFDLDSSKDNITDFYVGGDAIALVEFSFHAFGAYWLTFDIDLLATPKYLDHRCPNQKQNP